MERCFRQTGGLIDAAGKGVPVGSKQVAENVKVAGQLDVAGNVGEIAQHVTARGRGKRLAGRKIQIDVGAKLADGAALFVGNLAQRMPGGVFEKDIVVAVEPVFVVDITERFGLDPDVPEL